MFSKTITLGLGTEDASKYFIITPTPGVAWWEATTGNLTPWIDGASIAPVFSPHIGDLFDAAAAPGPTTGGTNTNKVDMGRICSMSFELVPVNNAFNSYGTITAFRTPMALAYGQAGQPASITGADAFVKINKRSGLTESNAYYQPSRNGFYGVSMRTSDDAQFLPIHDSEVQSTQHTAYVGATPPGAKVLFDGPILLWDDSMDTIVVRVDTPKTGLVGGPPSQDFILRVWKSYEYRPTFNSFLYQLAGNSAGYDPAALALYDQMAAVLPVGVDYRENPDFWSSILTAVKVGSGLLSGLPGLGGAVAKGVHSVASYLDRDDVITHDSDDGSGKKYIEKRERDRDQERFTRKHRRRYEDEWDDLSSASGLESKVGGLMISPTTLRHNQPPSLPRAIPASWRTRTVRTAKRRPVKNVTRKRPKPRAPNRRAPARPTRRFTSKKRTSRPGRTVQVTRRRKR